MRSEGAARKTLLLRYFSRHLTRGKRDSLLARGLTLNKGIKKIPEKFRDLISSRKQEVGSRN